MADRSKITRRNFVATINSMALTAPFATKIDLLSSLSPVRQEILRNDFFSVSFDTKTGRYDIARSNGDNLLSGSELRLTTGDGIISAGNSSFRHSLRSSKINDMLGEGMLITISSSDQITKIECNLQISLYKNHHALFIQSDCRNRSSEPIVLQSIEPVCSGKDTGGGLFWPQTSKVLTNGPMYYNPGKIVDFKATDTNPGPSWWNIGLFSGYNREGLVIGAVENHTAQGMVTIKREENERISITVQSTLSDGFILKPEGIVRSNKFAIIIGKSPYSALEGYGDIMGKLNNARVNSVINGWCNWFFTYEFITEEEVIRNAEFAARFLRPYGLEYIQVDEGYQRWHGDWEGNDRFPGGMKGLADRIHSMGLKPGLWIAPYVISEPTAIFRDHKEWLIKHPDGSIKRVGPWPDEDSDWAKNENPKRYGLDITHPGAAEWVYDLFDKISHQWGYEMIKIDFVDWSLLSAHHYHDPSISRAMAYRKGFEIMRKAAGDKCHLQDCGPGPITVGLLDTMRIELDQNYGYRNEAWNQYFNSTGSAPAAAKRYYFHKRTWINDADHLCINLLSPSQAQAAATLLALTGGNIISGDRLPELDPLRLEILKKTVPSYGEAARPVDLFDTDFQRIFALKIRKSFGEWTLAGFFNSDKSIMNEYNLPLERLWLDNSKTYILYDFWNNTYLGETRQEIIVKIAPESVLLLSIHEKPSLPKVISTDRHVLQGAVELEDVSWDSNTQILSGLSSGVAGSSYNVYIYIPDSHPWRQGGISLYHDFPDYTLKMTDKNILRMHLRFKDSNIISWNINFSEFFKTE